VSPEQQADARRYRSAWAAIVQLARDGYSWSGRERNRLLLNCGGGEFGDASASSGLDHHGDGRAMAIVDWDQDGDLDLWFRDRTGPRLRLMLNSHHSAEDDDFVAVKLEGTSCNRDAIGAVVEVIADGMQGRLVKSVRAGDLFLSQSSRWLHFGLGDAEVVSEVRVLWPGGAREVFTGTKAGGAFLLKEGAGLARVVERRARVIAPSTKTEEIAVSDERARIILPASIPAPPIEFRDRAGNSQILAVGGAPQLVVIWSEPCAHCGRDLASIAGAKAEFRKAGLQVTALSVDRLGEQLGKASRLMDSMKWPFEWGFVEGRTMDRISELQRALFDRTVPPSVPLALLVDRVGNVVAIYRGEIAITEVMADLKALDGADAGKRHKLAPPFAGRWFTKPVDPVYAVEFMARQFEMRLPEEALFYLEAARQRSVGDRRAAFGSELADKHHAIAMKYKNGREPGLAAEHFQRALMAKPSAEIYLNFGTMLASYGKLVEAQGLLEQALILEPGLQSAQKAIALVRKLIAEGN
jgi:hypothetical protein